MASEERGRFAPSPTGELHLGNARTAILAWLWAKAARGGFTMRVEDLDRPRVRPGLAQRQLEELAWLGLTWDEGPDPRSGEDTGPRGPYRQSQRDALYEAAIGKLGDHVYECFCSRSEIAAASAPHGPQDDGPRYPGTCANLTLAQRAERRRTRAPALRLRVPRGPVRFTDELKGPQEFDPAATVGDFVLRRADGVFAYQLAVVVDDAAMEITQVLRGDDLLPSTARQILLYRLLGLREPRRAHAGLVVAASGERLSKRDRASSLSTLRASGRDPREVVSLLCAASGLPKLEGRSVAERVDTFALERIPPGSVRLGAV
ncbi:MAG TPA: tRNA glutamyl-Q(34) synthetase GluQRS [Myxococcales bacterium]|nr:tRNA glutamyl-Q(34) synthetase GluQRS [Myxococcales bacterium]